MTGSGTEASEQTSASSKKRQLSINSIRRSFLAGCTKLICSFTRLARTTAFVSGKGAWTSSFCKTTGGFHNFWNYFNIDQFLVKQLEIAVVGCFFQLMLSAILSHGSGLRKRHSIVNRLPFCELSVFLLAIIKPLNCCSYLTSVNLFKTISYQHFLIPPLFFLGVFPLFQYFLLPLSSLLKV